MDLLTGQVSKHSGTRAGQRYQKRYSVILEILRYICCKCKIQTDTDIHSSLVFTGACQRYLCKCTIKYLRIQVQEYRY